MFGACFAPNPLLALNGVLASFGSASGALTGRDQGSPFANIICAAASAATDVGGDPGSPGKAHAHAAHHCVLCGMRMQGTATPDQSAKPAAASFLWPYT